MALTAVATAEIIKTYQQGEKDTGSPEVQIALFTTRINQLTDHLKANKRDLHTQFGLTMLVSKRRRLMRYLKAKFPERYLKLIQTLGIRG